MSHMDVGFFVLERSGWCVFNNSLILLRAGATKAVGSCIVLKAHQPKPAMFRRRLHISSISIFFLAAYFLVLPVQAQEGAPLPKNSLYLELGGNALAYSINYDRIVGDVFSVRAGIGFFSTDLDEGGSSSIAGIPIMANYLLGSGNSRLELGAGILIVTGSFDVAGASDSGAGVAGTGTFAYRFQKPEGGVFFKAGFTPIIAGGSFIPWFGVSIGYTL